MMGLVGKLLLLLVAAMAVGLGVLWTKLTQPPPLVVLESQWWGPGQPYNVDTSIRPFKINISDEVLDDLNDRLELVPTLTAPLEGVSFQYGFNTNYLESVVEMWRTEYDWRARETALNALPQFRTTVDGLSIHFLHVKPRQVPAGTRVLPLLMLHGWPGSIREFYGIIPLLTTPKPGRDFVFEVVAPSLPGYGFSEGAAKPGLGAAQISVVMTDLMTRIGFDRFYVQGGDWGSLIASNMVTMFPDRIIGHHSNMCFVNTPLSFLKHVLGSVWPSMVVDEAHQNRMYPLGSYFANLLEEFGYMHLQATKPDTIGVALRDSPIGLAAYILEKFSTWTDMANRALPDGGLTKKFSMHDLLDNVMIYWVTGSITTSMRLYSESFNKEQMGLGIDRVPTSVPTSCAMFPNELAYVPEDFLREKYTNLVKFTHMARGGHFAAFEEPKLLADDIWESVEIIEGMQSTKTKK